jgi:hypothetical protein
MQGLHHFLSPQTISELSQSVFQLSVFSDQHGKNNVIIGYEMDQKKLKSRRAVRTEEKR